VRISSRPGWKTSPLARGRIHCCKASSHISFSLAERGGPYIFCQQVLQRGDVEYGLGQELLQPPVLILERLQPARLEHL
jgi:hypothetical protein